MDDFEKSIFVLSVVIGAGIFFGIIGGVSFYFMWLVGATFPAVVLDIIAWSELRDKLRGEVLT
jgi:hypothetical protein